MDALDKLPAAPPQVFRRTSTLPAPLDQYREDEDVTHAGCASATQPHWWHPDPYLFSIRSRTGKCISHYAAGRDEVLFKARTRFYVICRRSLGNCIEIQLQEV